MDLVEKYRTLKEKKDSLERDVTAKEAEYRTIKAQYDNLLKELCEKYSVKSVDEAKALLAKEDAELADEINKAESLIRTLDGSTLDSVDLGI